VITAKEPRTDIQLLQCHQVKHDETSVYQDFQKDIYSISKMAGMKSLFHRSNFTRRYQTIMTLLLSFGAECDDDAYELYLISTSILKN